MTRAENNKEKIEGKSIFGSDDMKKIALGILDVLKENGVNIEDFKEWLIEVKKVLDKEGLKDFKFWLEDKKKKEKLNATNAQKCYMGSSRNAGYKIFGPNMSSMSEFYKMNMFDDDGFKWDGGFH